MKERISMKNLELIDGKKINVPDEVDITKGGYFDEMKYNLLLYKNISTIIDKLKAL